ncbi:SRPBCC domain-containing protein [Aureispira sp. CCB-QB1]|uniref:SRPBCC domain-containing protein n=1 Tax=Aureispira sp. CCB-QB1 TaxID=1313421 RepID=UPI000695AE50|nr:SRPBCC domain-containing protein [Aureispira sp. CCB-QB1]
MPKHLIESKIIINAPIQSVWKVLSNFDNYHQWNPFTPKIDIQNTIGSTIGLHVRLNPKSAKTILQKETLLAWEEGQRLEWGIQNSWFVQTIRIQRLTAIDAQTTEYYTSDAFKGPLTGVILLLYRQKIQIGFDDVCMGLKKETEGLQGKA